MKYYIKNINIPLIIDLGKMEDTAKGMSHFILSSLKMHTQIEGALH